MGIAAIPNYLGSDFTTASPGLRFGMYLPLWGRDERTQELLWETTDRKYQVRGQDRTERAVNVENKVPSLRQALELTAHDKAAAQGWLARQTHLAEALADTDQLLRVEAVSVAPFSTGLGNEHPTENGFAFLNPYGLPYLAGSGVKGVLRAAARELAGGDWGDSLGWDAATIDALFGVQADDDASLRRGALICWDVLPQIAGDRLTVEIMTPHQSHYLQGDQSPHDSRSPIPVAFLAVPPRSQFVFNVQCNTRLLAGSDPALVTRWPALVQAALEHAFQWLGFGAKTRVGYGAMQVDAQAARRAEQRREEQAREREQARAKAEAEARRAAMPPEFRAVQEALDARPDRNASELSLLLKWIKTGSGLDPVLLPFAALMARDRMIAAKKWVEKSTKKNETKDHDHQDTKAVLARLPKP